jgi:hypothetical protein
MYQAPGNCPTCETQLGIRELGCSQCGTIVRGDWFSNPFQRLSSDQQSFLILFVRSRGNLSEVERALGVSYPTVRAKLEELINAMADAPAEPQAEADSAMSSRRAVLDRVARGELPASEALELLRRKPDSEGDHD